MSTQSQLRFGKKVDKLGIENIRDLINNRIEESLNLEYKQPSKNIDQDCNFLARTISGFLNTDGGILIYGVTEKKEKGHNYPDEVKWCTYNKERIESLLKSRINPWNNGILIARIKNGKNEHEGVFTFDVPKSKNPPHMCNNIYYQRLNYQTQPMSHWNVFRVFQTKWIRREELHQKIFEPLYSEIKLNFERLEKFEQVSINRYRHITTAEIYLFEQIETTLRKSIDKYFTMVQEYNKNINWSKKTELRIIHSELSKVFPKRKDWFEQRSAENHLYLKVKAREPSGRITEMRPQLDGVLLLKKHQRIT